jgi:hypothetical protein
MSPRDIAFIVSLSCITTWVFPCPASDDPLVWSAPKRPEFRETLKEAEYESRLQSTLKRIEWLPEEKQRWYPPAYYLVEYVDPEGTGGRNGMRVGDLIVGMGDRLTGGPWPRKFETGEAVVWFTPQGRRRSAVVNEDLVGVQGEVFVNSHAAYLRGRQQSHDFRKEVIVGIAQRRDDPQLAETAWYHAIRKGYQPDYLSDWCGVVIQQAQAGTGADFAWHAIHAAEREYDLPSMPLYQAAIANCRLQAAFELSTKWRGALPIQPDSLAILVAEHQSRVRTEQPLIAPSERADAMYRRDIRDALRPANSITKGWDSKPLQEETPFKMEAGTARFMPLFFAPKEPARDLEVNVQFSLTPFDSQESEYTKIMEIALLDLQSSSRVRPNKSDVVLLAAVTADRLDYTVAHSNIVGTRHAEIVKRGTAGPDQVFHIRLVRVAELGEIFINGRRMAFVPVDPKVDDVGVLIKAVGIKADVKRVQVDELIPRS